MDFEEKSLAEFAENDLRELLDSNYYAEALRVAGDIEFSSLLEHDLCSNVVLNDRLIAEASLGVLAQSLTGGPISLTGPHKGINAPIKTEHSYSLCSVNPKPSEQDLSDLENECFPAIPINEAEGSRSSLKNPLFGQKSLKVIAEEEEEEEGTLDSLPLEGGSLQRHSSSETLSCCGDCCRPDEDLQLDEESLSSSFTMEDLDNEVPDEVLEQEPPRLICTNHTQFPFQSLSNKPKVTVISVANDKNNVHTQLRINCTQEKSQSRQENGVENKNPFLNNNGETNLPKPPIVNRNNSFISVQRPDNSFGFPPTPPSCSSSDSESGGDQSPPRLCPLYETLSSNFCNPKKTGAVRNANRTPITTSLISSQPRGATGVLNLTEEEKRTLISEGYPVPSRLPLSKAEEKSLKKIRRKIKNKISAQESRRKKKEYMDTLEQRVDNLEQQNKEYKRKVDSLQKKNSDLLNELHNLQSLVNKDERSRSRVTERATLIS